MQVVVYGAGAIGLYVGGRLAASGVAVHFIARPATVEALNRDGLKVTDLDGHQQIVPPSALSASETLGTVPAGALVLLAVKGGATRAAGVDLAAHCAPGTAVISLQNGVDNVARLRESAPSLQAIGGMVPFNVVQRGPTTVVQTTQGDLASEDQPLTRDWAPRFQRAGLRLQLHRDIRAVQWGKLLLNLNNPINALADVPLRQQLLDRGYRCLLADLQDEALAALAASGIVPARVTPLPPRWLPGLLRLPTPLFRLLAQRMLKISPEAGSSMQEDRRRGRPTEIDDLCGAVQRLAAAAGSAAPLNRRMQALLQRSPYPQRYDAASLRAALRRD